MRIIAIDNLNNSIYITNMKVIRTLFLLIFFLILVIYIHSSSAQELNDVIGFVDRNQNGINDLFRDADGDGVNDVTSEFYAHDFQFADEDGNGINDLWMDSDGDGVNDYLGEALNTVEGQIDSTQLPDYVLDADHDGYNDITGIGYSEQNLYGFQFGNIDEERGVNDSFYIDEDGDGMNDHFRFQDRIREHGYREMDYFMDRDGDGIADDRGLQWMRRNRQNRGNR